MNRLWVRAIAVAALLGGLAACADDEDTRTPTPAASVATTASPTATATGTASDGPTVTVQNDPTFASVLRATDSCNDEVGAFASAYAGRTIEFDASVAAMAGGLSILDRTDPDDGQGFYDILVVPGDRGPATEIGPSFQFHDVTLDDLNLVGDNVPDSIGNGDRLHVVAQVGEYTMGCLIRLAPVSTELR
ncbi:DUF4839 domain-containing protein [Sporichthya polymorpha]|uniref:DUF4839 domain-containing protein n=1 Tax=Sporichthya polymorpha TaxID=35751 RepID=UPI00035E8C23|nr:DUF4839 domain-containing protein [Sporichthya polymorpha]